MTLDALSQSAYVHQTINPFPSTVEDMNRFANAALEELRTRITEYHKEKLSFDATVIGWNDILGEFGKKCLVLMFANLTTQDEKIIAAAKERLQELNAKLESAFNDQKALSSVLSLGRQMVENLTPSQNYWLMEMLGTVETANPLYADAMQLKADLSKQPALLYTYVPGQIEDKKLPENRTLKILNWNICFFDDLVPMLFGGVRPFVDRVDAVAQAIIKSDADVVCLQEVFSLKGGDELLQKLQPHYAHFYTKIGPRVIGFSKENQGIPSGLFVASRYPLKNVQFTPYTPEQTPSNRAYGIFAADLYSDQEPLAHLVTTHLQPGDSPEDVEYRAKQMTIVRSDLEQSKLSSFVCGDFNIEENSPEAHEQLKGFVMNKSPGWTCRELRDYWFKADQNVTLFNEQPMELETIDYFLAEFKAGPTPSFQTEVGIVSEVNNPGDALSDHQYELTTVTFPQQQ